MIELEIILKDHDWSLAGYLNRPRVDKLMKENPDQASELWEQHCPWSDTNGGYIKWTKNE